MCSQCVRQAFVGGDKVGFRGDRQSDIKAVVHGAVECGRNSEGFLSSVSEDTVGKLRSRMARTASSAEICGHLPWRTAFHRMLANSAQNRSGTRNRISPLL